MRQRQKLQRRKQLSNTTKFRRLWRRENIPEASATTIPLARQRARRCCRKRRFEHLTEGPRLGGLRRVQVHVHVGQSVDDDNCNECENHVRAKMKSRECEVAQIQKMTIDFGQFRLVEFGTTKGWGPEGWSPERRVGAKISLFFFASRGILVVFEAPGP